MFRSVLVEIRDAGTFIPALVTWLPEVRRGAEHYLLWEPGVVHLNGISRIVFDESSRMLSVWGFTLAVDEKETGPRAETLILTLHLPPEPAPPEPDLETLQAAELNEQSRLLEQIRDELRYLRELYADRTR